MTTAQDYNGLVYFLQQYLGELATSTLVKVVSFTPGSGGLIAGVVNVLPLVNQIDPSGNATAHETLYSLPYFRVQAGNSAIVIDPVANDIGFAAFCSRDISTVKNTSAQANPGSFRQFSMSDGIYFGAIGSLNGAPTESIHMTSGGGITITTPGIFTVNASGKTWTFGSAGFTNSNGNVEETHRHVYTLGTGAPPDTGTPV